jgi:hypothetical protein
LGAAYVPPTSLSAKIQNKLTGHKRRTHEQEPAPTAVAADEDGDEDSRSAAVSKPTAVKFAAKADAAAPQKKVKLAAPTALSTIKPPPPTGFKPPLPSTGIIAPANMAPVSAESTPGAEGPKATKKQRKKVRSRQKNLRKDKYDWVWGDAGCCIIFEAGCCIIFVT